ncbi:BgtASP-20958 [Blumeria graminis f. sp. tritici]|uniref:BgtASP-20958 n=2 Tax=Blumeria graminis f. sp. tritici TaxID=62690 RepID=A0A9X9LBF6_BLUGR|nr:hypothetical protein BGT96224_ASP20958 [Blumeria graminis f. sp. tritici 96224]VCU41336.1 BgtASP-20958 [Blumeria graminis f. sp. tritici]
MFLLALFQLFAYALASSVDEVSATGHGNAFKYGTGGGAVGFVILVLDIIVFMEVLKSSRPLSHKLLWCLVVFMFPIFGLIIYWLFSNRDAYSNSGYEAIV